ncbi:MAG: Serine/threonine protein kinase involved in cell cycle control [Rhodobacteraceae bacterium HLUCCA08]|nr:MAG: Serine/threonine protein kinase involved in cell cycle control [Rhodobacteraceae bacterium HLUCCA08]
MTDTPPDSRCDPRDIHQLLLDVTGRALMAGDFDAFARHFTLPQQIDSFEGLLLVKDSDQLRVVFDGVCAHYRSHGVTEMVRTSTEAAYQGADKITCTHESRLYRGETLIHAPYSAFSVLVRTGDGWKVSFSQYAITDAPDLNAALAGHPVPAPTKHE